MTHRYFTGGDIFTAVRHRKASRDTALIEEEFGIELCVHGCHIYSDVCVAAVGKDLPCEYEAMNMKDIVYLCCRYFCFRVSFLGSSGWRTLGTQSGAFVTKPGLLGGLSILFCFFLVIANDSMQCSCD